MIVKEKDKTNVVVKEYIRKKSRWRNKMLKRDVEASNHILSAPKAHYIGIDPNSYRVLAIYKGIREVEYATNKRHLQGRLHRYIRNILPKNGSPLIAGMILVAIEPKEMEGINLKELEAMIQKKAADKIVIMQLQRIKNNIDSFTQKEKEKIFNFLANVESPRQNDINIKINLDNDEEIN